MTDPAFARPSCADDPLLGQWVPRGACWHRLQGGRTNDLWRVSTDAGVLVVKRYRPVGATPMFPNNPVSELAALRRLRGLGLAPEPVALVHTQEGDCLIYSYVNGQVGGAVPADLGRVLSRLHRVEPPGGLRAVPSGSMAILRQGDRMLADTAAAGDLAALRPHPDMPAAVDPVFLHGDPVPANVIATGGGPVLIDWQCPAVGDPVEDLGLALSPAMQHLYGSEPMTVADQEALLSAYGNPQAKQRFRALAPALHWRMAVYCLWRYQHRGESPHDRVALGLEIAALKAAVQSSR